MSNRAFVLGVILLMNLCALLLSGCAFNSSAGKGLKELWVIDPEKLNAAEQTLALTLQGLVAKEESAIWFAGDGMNALILEELREEGTEAHSTDSVWELLQVFRAHVKDAIVYELGTDSINVATSLCGPKQAVAVDESILEEAQAEGLDVLLDVRDYDELRAFEEYRASVTPHTAQRTRSMRTWNRSVVVYTQRR